MSHEPTPDDQTPDDLVAERPTAAGVPEDEPAELGEIEGARMLGNQARARLRADGFTDAQIDEWAEAFFADVGGGEADDLIAWIAQREGRTP